MKKILFVSGSVTNGSTKLLLEELQHKFWLEYSTDLTFIRDFDCTPCMGCEHCQKTNHECIKDDKLKILMDKILDADIVVLGTPTYFSNMSGLTKNLIDRTYKFYGTNALKNKKFLYLYTGKDNADTLKKYLDIAFAGFNASHSILNLGSFAVTTVNEGQFINKAAKDNVIDKMAMLIRANIE